MFSVKNIKFALKSRKLNVEMMDSFFDISELRAVYLLLQKVFFNFDSRKESQNRVRTDVNRFHINFCSQKRDW